MKAFRYNCEKEATENITTAERKNPNAVKFYAKNMDWCQKLQYIYNEDGDATAECKLEVAGLKM